MKSIDYFNKELMEKYSPIELISDPALYSMRIGKKKNGRPSFDYPCTFNQPSYNMIEVGL
jgi:hypothetical protein